MKTLTEMLAAVCRQHAGRTAVAENELAVSYRDLETAISSFSERLYEAGTRSADRVAVLLPNGLNFIRSFFAIARLGAVVVPLNDQYQGDRAGSSAKRGRFFLSHHVAPERRLVGAHRPTRSAVVLRYFYRGSSLGRAGNPTSDASGTQSGRAGPPAVFLRFDGPAQADS